VLDLLHDLKGATAMTDPKDTDTTKTTADGELPEDALDAVAGGSSDVETFEEAWAAGHMFTVN
jgi:hypothetical protein